MIMIADIIFFAVSSKGLIPTSPPAYLVSNLVPGQRKLYAGAYNSKGKCVYN